ncbi:MAG: hypothetical protein H0U22_03230 [Geodermatophilaceae bacterium]|nr:hypothetical protein [Geodermatophilaceae bacterium]
MAVRADRGPAAGSALRTVAVAGGFLCAVVASVTLFVTENPDVLRIGILVALWAFGLAALAAGRRQTEQAVAASAELGVRKTYELELEREVAARREYELALEAELRRELQDVFTAEIGALREEMTRLRRELSEQWDSELRVERMVMRTPSVRMGGDRREPLEHESTGRASIAAGPSSEAEVRDRYHPHHDVFRVRPFESEPPTKEFAAVGSVELSVPTSPLPPPSLLHSPNGPRPPSPPSSGFPTLINTGPPPAQPARVAEQPTGNGASDDDVLARILAEAGAGVGGRRRKHRYADEDE